MRRPIVALVFVGVLAMGGLALMASLAPKAAQKSDTEKQGAGGLKVNKDNSLPAVSVGVSTGFNPTVQIDTGPGEAWHYLEPGWSYTPIKQDWTRT